MRELLNYLLDSIEYDEERDRACLFLSIPEKDPKNIRKKVEEELASGFEDQMDFIWTSLSVPKFVERFFKKEKLAGSCPEISQEEPYTIYACTKSQRDYILSQESAKNFFRMLEGSFGISISWEIRTKEVKSLETETVVLSKPKEEEKKPESEKLRIGRKPKKEPIEVALENLTTETGNCVIRGEMKKTEIRSTKNPDFFLFEFLIEDETSAAACKMFFNKKQFTKFADSIHDGIFVKLIGSYAYDDYKKDFIFQANYLEETTSNFRMDRALQTRSEINIHTQKSLLEGLVNPKKLVATLSAWNHKVVGITDESCIQAYPEIYPAAKKAGIKVLFGLDAKVLHEENAILTNLFGVDTKPLFGHYTVFDIETTGLSKFNDDIIEIGAVRIEDGQVAGVFNEFVNPGRVISSFISELTGIENHMVQNADPIDVVLPKFLDFAKGSIFVAHNAEFDIGFIRQDAMKLGIPFQPVVIDTLWLARALVPENKRFGLGTLVKQFKVTLENHHRACDDARATADLLLKFFELMEERGIPVDENLNHMKSDLERARYPHHRALIYVQKQETLPAFYKLISDGNTEYFDHLAGYPEEQIEAIRDGLLIGGGGYQSDLFQAIAGSYPIDVVMNLAIKYDFFVLEPISLWKELRDENYIRDKAHFEEIQKKIYELAKRLDKEIIAVGDVYYMNPADHRARNILRNYQRKRYIEREPGHYLRTTDEMLQEFEHFPEDVRRDLVIAAPNRFAERFDDILPIPKGTFIPEIPNSDVELKKTCFETAWSIYGKPLPKLVEDRLNRELDSIISNGYAVLYIVAAKLVKESNRQGYLVGSRGSVGSSFAATMAGITEVNPLLPHYVCPKCKRSEFLDDGKYSSGYDLPEKNCPDCGVPMIRNGHDIPFEVFLGFHGDKQPDIDLNFAQENQADIHKYTEKIFGEGKVFRAGTISGVQEKTARGFVLKYLEQEYPEETVRTVDRSRMEWLVNRMVNTKRTTGQHPGGLIICPADHSIYDFCPIQYPADQKSNGVKTTHFTYRSLEETLLKLDELGQSTPSIIRMLQNLTGVDPLKVPIGDEETMKIFVGTESLKPQREYSNSDTGALGIPEFGTEFVRGMLKTTKPTTFGELVRISGLSHGTGVWLGNAEQLIREGVTDLEHAICTRDDIMVYLIRAGLEKELAFKTMESVRKGRKIPPGVEPKMKELGIPQWYIDSCNTIEYMFPKAHAVAYVQMSYRIAYFKVHYPAAFYSTYFTQKLGDFSTELLVKSLDEVQMQMGHLEDKKRVENNLSDLDKNKYSLLELLEEMFARGLTFADVDIYQSDATDFKPLDEKTVLPPLAALNDVSPAQAQLIVEARKDGKFISIEDFVSRTGVNKSCQQSLISSDVIGEMPESNQISFLELDF